MSPQTRHNLALLVTNYLKHLKFARTAASNTSKSYANDLGQFLQPLGIKKILYRDADHPEFTVELADECERIAIGQTPQRVTERALTALLRQAQARWRNLKASSRNRKLAAVKRFFRWLHEEGWIDRDLAAMVTMPKVPNRLPHFISVDEAISVLKAVASQSTVDSAQQETLILLLYGGGLRVSEACGLRWADVDAIARTVRVTGKGDKQRLVALPARCWPALLRLPRQGKFVFGERPLNTRQAYEWVRQAGARAGLVKPLHPHALRHSYATHMLSSGADLRVLQELLGHTSLSATEKYTHLSVDHLARTLESRHPLGKKGR